MIWNKPNCQPESVKDRPTHSHEYVFLFSKSEKYSYDWQAIMEPAADPKQKSKNRRTVWNINTEPYPGSHFAVYPRALVRLCVAAGSHENGRVLDPFFGSVDTRMLDHGVIGHEDCESLAERATCLESPAGATSIAVAMYNLGELKILLEHRTNWQATDHARHAKIISTLKTVAKNYEIEVPMHWLQEHTK